MKKVLIYGGSFNPFHNGHKALLKKALKVEKFNEVWILPNSLIEHQRFMSDKDRFDIIKNNLRLLKNVKVLDIETKQEKPVETIDTIDKLISFDTKLYFLMGSDCLSSIKRWKGYERLKTVLTFIVGARKGYREEVPKSFIELPKKPAVRCSSTEIRQGDLNNLSAYCAEKLKSNPGYHKMVKEHHERKRKLAKDYKDHHERKKKAIEILKRARERKELEKTIDK